MIKINTVIFICILLIGGCAKNPDQIKAMNELQSQVESSTPICKTDEQCLRMMDAAELWISDHSRMRIRDITRNRITTYTPLKSSDTTWYYVVTKRPYKDGSRIMLDIGVRNVFSQISDKEEMLARKLEFNSEIGSIE